MGVRVHREPGADFATVDVKDAAGDTATFYMWSDGDIVLETSGGRKVLMHSDDMRPVLETYQDLLADESS